MLRSVQQVVAMSNVQRSPAVVTFGPFEADLDTQELRKHGLRLRLPGQSFQILGILLKNPGKLVSREELQQALWPADTHVDFEQGVNAAINRLREVLGDSADSPHLIETLPRRGYRFIGQIALRNGDDSTASASVVTSSESDAGLNSQGAVAGRKTKPLMRNSIAVGLAALMALGVAASRIQPRVPTVVGTERITNDGHTKDSMNPLASDGARLYFTEGLPMTSGSRIAQVSTVGGETSWLTTSLNSVWAVGPVSPDHSQLLVASGASKAAIQLWLQPLPGGAPRRAAKIASHMATWSGDGQHIVYPLQQSIMIANRDGSEPKVLAKASGDVYTIRYSPDGAHIRFSAGDERRQTSSIWEMNADGSNMHPLLPGWKETQFACCGSWSPDGRYYYFAAGRGFDESIWVLPERLGLLGHESGVPSKLLAGPLRYTSLTPSSDGKTLFVVGQDARVELARYDLQAQRFDPFLPGLSAGPIDFSQDKKWIVYVAYPEMTLWRSRVDGSEKMQLTAEPIRAYEPRWSPDGSQVAFMDVSFNHSRRIGVVAASGGEPEWLEQDGADPTWWPDGKSLVYGGFDGRGQQQIYRLMLASKESSVVPDSVGLWSPRLSPDGRYISALGARADKLWLFDGDSKSWTVLLEGNEVGYNEWSHDGRYVYVRETLDGAGEMIRVRMSDRSIEKLFSFRDFPQNSDVFSWWIGLTPDDAPLLMRDRSIQEIYAAELSFR